MSSIQLTHIKTLLLATGLDFSITSKTLSNKDILLQNREKEEADTIPIKIPKLQTS